MQAVWWKQPHVQRWAGACPHSQPQRQEQFQACDSWLSPRSQLTHSWQDPLGVKAQKEPVRVSADRVHVFRVSKAGHLAEPALNFFSAAHVLCVPGQVTELL